MSDILIQPGHLRGSVRAPSSKSFAHRALICSALAALKNGETSKLVGVDKSMDIDATKGCLEAMGFNFFDEGGQINTLFGGFLNKKLIQLNCKESGSTLRFILPVAAALGISAEFTGEGRLPQRPVIQFREMLETHGVNVEIRDDGLPIKIDGKLQPGVFEVPGHISSQYISGLLMALPILEGDSEICLTSPLESAPYVDITIEVMKVFGVEVLKTESGFIIKGNQKYKSNTYTIEGDFSQGAFWLTAGFLGSDIEVTGLNQSSVQGDKGILEALMLLGAEIEYTPSGIKARPGSPKDLDRTIDGRQIPDIIPILAAGASLIPGTTRFINVERLRIKESDRLAAVAQVINKLGGQVEEQESSLIVKGQETLAGGCVINAWNDHRIAMMLAVLGLRCEKGITIEGYECVNKSYPTFFEEFNRLKG